MVARRHSLHLLAVLPIFVTERTGSRLCLLLIFAALAGRAGRPSVECSIDVPLLLGGLVPAALRHYLLTDPALWATVTYNSGRSALEANDLAGRK